MVANNFKKPLQRYKTRDSQRQALGHACSCPKACDKQSMEKNTQKHPAEKQGYISNHSGQIGNPSHGMHVPLICFNFRKIQENV